MRPLRLVKRVSGAAWRATGQHLKSRWGAGNGHPRSLRQELVLEMMRRDMGRAADVPPAEIRRRELPTPLRPALRRQVVLEETTLGGRPSLSIRPHQWAADGSTLLYLHGGGYCVCSPSTHRALGAQIAVESGMRCVLLDYRLAPEHPHPVAIDDATAAVDDLLQDIGDPRRLFMGGDSAGGGLTLATLLRRRDGGAALPASAILLSPWVDLSLSGESIDSQADGDYLSRRILSRFAEHYLGDTAPRDPLASPLHAELSGLPPMLIQLGGSETLFSEGQELGERLGGSGVDVELQVFPGACHVFQAFAPLHPDAVPAIRGIGAYLRRASGSETT